MPNLGQVGNSYEVPIRIILLSGVLCFAVWGLETPIGVLTTPTESATLPSLRDSRKLNLIYFVYSFCLAPIILPVSFARYRHCLQQVPRVVLVFRKSLLDHEFLGTVSPEGKAFTKQISSSKHSMVNATINGKPIRSNH